MCKRPVTLWLLNLQMLQPWFVQFIALSISILYTWSPHSQGFHFSLSQDLTCSRSFCKSSLLSALGENPFPTPLSSARRKWALILTICVWKPHERQLSCSLAVVADVHIVCFVDLLSPVMLKLDTSVLKNVVLLTWSLRDRKFASENQV